MNRVAITGASGRMGRTLVRLLQNHDELVLTQASDRHDSPAIDRDAGFLDNLPDTGVTVARELDAQQLDTVIDFTHPTALSDHVSFCRRHNKALMVGTTGLGDSELDLLKAAGEDICVVLAANTSVGVNLCASLAATAAEVIGPVTDIEIVESHHRHKVDAPSGTALYLGQSIADVLGKDLKRDGVYQRHGQTGERPDGSIGFSTIRGGDIAGEHTVMFIGENERIEITHRATDRVIFARGALRAAEWVTRKQLKGEKGFFGMREVLGLN
ncbi:MAG: 4-hydroxy-tetrahydrodipicolinate reductase [Pseudomonadota bacterium]